MSKIAEAGSARHRARAMGRLTSADRAGLRRNGDRLGSGSPRAKFLIAKQRLATEFRHLQRLFQEWRLREWTYEQQDQMEFDRLNSLGGHLIVEAVSDGLIHNYNFNFDGTPREPELQEIFEYPNVGTSFEKAGRYFFESACDEDTFNIREWAEGTCKYLAHRIEQAEYLTPDEIRLIKFKAGETRKIHALFQTIIDVNFPESDVDPEFLTEQQIGLGLHHALMIPSIARDWDACDFDTFCPFSGFSEGIQRLFSLSCKFGFCPSPSDRFLSFLQHIGMLSNSQEKDKHSLPSLIEPVTLDQAAGMAKKSKRTLEKYVGTKIPLPDVKGVRGRANLWEWSKIRPFLETICGFALPESYPRFGKSLTQPYPTSPNLRNFEKK